MKGRYSTESVPCPKCGTPPGRSCRTPSGVERTHYPHKARRKALDKVIADESTAAGVWRS